MEASAYKTSMVAVLNQSLVKEFAEEMTNFISDFASLCNHEVNRAIVKLEPAKELYAGMCYCRPGEQNEIVINSLMLSGLPDWAYFEVVAHELAHHVNWEVGYQDCHGKNWKKFASFMGAIPQAYTLYPIHGMIANDISSFYAYQSESDGRFRWIDESTHKVHKGVMKSSTVWRHTDNKSEALKFQANFDLSSLEVLKVKVLDKKNRNHHWWRNYNEKDLERDLRTMASRISGW